MFLNCSAGVRAIWRTPAPGARMCIHQSILRALCAASGSHATSAETNLVGGQTPLLLTDIGEGITEVEVVQWHVKQGDTIQQFEPLVEVQSDKATVTITSRYDGVVSELNYVEGDTAAVGEPLCFVKTEEPPLPKGVSADDIAAEGAKAARSEDNEMAKRQEVETPEGLVQVNNEVRADTAKQASKISPSETSHNLEPHKVREPRETLAIPSVRHVAKEHGLDISKILGSGKDGRVTQEDVERAIQQPSSDTPSSADNTSCASPTRSPVSGLADYTVPLRGLQRAMSKSMTASLQIPQLGLDEEVSMDALHDLRTTLRQHLLSAPPGTVDAPPMLTYLPFFIKATSLALADVPLLNARVNDATLSDRSSDSGNSSGEVESVTFRHPHNIAVAMHTAAGLVVPVVHGVEGLSVLGVARELGRLGQEARRERPRFSVQDLSGGTFALSNIGAIGGVGGRPLVVEGQVGIGALGRVRKEAVVRASKLIGDVGEDEELVVGRVMRVCWSADHRVVDGATMAQFSNAWKKYVETPQIMLLYLK